MFRRDKSTALSNADITKIFTLQTVWKSSGKVPCIVIVVQINLMSMLIFRVRERSRKSPVSWSQKVRHQWQNSPKQSGDKGKKSSYSEVVINKKMESIFLRDQY